MQRHNVDQGLFPGYFKYNYNVLYIYVSINRNNSERTEQFQMFLNELKQRGTLYMHKHGSISSIYDLDHHKDHPSLYVNMHPSLIPSNESFFSRH